MDTIAFAISPELKAAVVAGHGMAEFVDPSSAKTYLLVEQEEVNLPDEYIQAKLDEATAAFERGDVMQESLSELLARTLDKLAAAQQPPQINRNEQ